MKLLNLFTGTILAWIITILTFLSGPNEFIGTLFSLTSFGITTLYVVELIKNVK